ncbi:MAG: hypothetical protein SVM80_09810 [Halobacteriota archaeon]|nr:hypothetical protein [Halobacteriota archaeon]
MPEKIVKRSRNFTPNLYFDVPFNSKKEFGIERGDKIEVLFKRVLDSDGNTMIDVEKRVKCEVSQRDGRFYLPPQIVSEFNIFGGEYYEFLLEKLIKPDGKEISINAKGA